LNKLSTKLLFVRTKADVEEIEKIAKDKILNEAVNVNSKKAFIISLHVKGLVARLLNKTDEMFDAFQSLVFAMENNISLISELPKSYVVAHGYIIRHYAIKRRYTDGFKTIDKLKALWLNREFRSTDLQIAIFSNSYINEMLLYAYIGQHDKAKNVIPAVIKGLEKYETKINEEELLRIYQVITMVYFGVGEYSKALHWVNRIINSNYTELRQDIIRISKLINLIIHFELGNDDLLPYIYKSTSRFVEGLENKYQFEILFLEHFKKIALSKRDGKQLSSFVKFKEEMQIVFTDRYERNALEYFNFYAWLDSKIHSISFSDAIKIRKQNMA
jgi:tetratricopeptide (TPR) repeat protein